MNNMNDMNNMNNIDFGENESLVDALRSELHPEDFDYVVGENRNRIIDRIHEYLDEIRDGINEYYEENGVDLDWDDDDLTCYMMLRLANCKQALDKAYDHIADLNRQIDSVIDDMVG